MGSPFFFQKRNTFINIKPIVMIEKIYAPNTVRNLPNNEVTRLINSENYMSVEHMVNCLSVYTLDFLMESMRGIRKRQMTRYVEAVERIRKIRGL